MIRAASNVPVTGRSLDGLPIEQVLLAFRATHRADSKYQIQGTHRDCSIAFPYLLTTATTVLSGPGHAGAPS